MGIDLAMPMDTPLRSFCNGVVEHVVNYGDTNIGKGVIIRAANGARYIYGHMDEIDVHEGQTVHQGTFLGLSGNTGHSSGPHLHFGEQVDGQYAGPSNVIDKVDQAAGGTGPLGWWSSVKDHFNIEDHIEEHVSTITQHIVLGALAAVGSVALHMLYSVALIGGGILIVLKQLGFEHRWLKPSVLAGAYVLLRFIFGG